MPRLNLALALVLLVCALATVTAQHRSRQLFQALEAEQTRAHTLDVEFDRLQIELSTWAIHPRIEKIAAERLRMHTPDPKRVVRVAEPEVAP